MPDKLRMRMPSQTAVEQADESGPPTPSFLPGRAPPSFGNSGTSSNAQASSSKAATAAPPLNMPSTAASSTASSSSRPPSTGTTTPDAALPTDLDYTLPMSTLFRLGTARAHTAAEHSPGAIALARGTLPLAEYVRYLALLWMVYAVLERELERCAADEILRGTYRPEVLARCAALEKDIAFLGQKVEREQAMWSADEDDAPYHPRVSFPSTSQSSAASGSTATTTLRTPFPVPPFLRSTFAAPPPAITAYQSHLAAIAQRDPARLLAHAYVRYLGDLSGGQFVRARLGKAYGLPGAVGRETDRGSSAPTGLEFYDFDDAGAVAADGSSREDAAERKRRMGELKDWFRTGVDLAVGDDAKLKAELVEEAIVAFDMATGIFYLLKAPATDGTPSKESSGAAKGHANGHANGHKYKSAALQRSEAELATATVPSQSTLAAPAYKVVALLLAVGIAHFAFVISGRSGWEGPGCAPRTRREGVAGRTGMSVTRRDRRGTMTY